jgi:hypothetical protein
MRALLKTADEEVEIPNRKPNLWDVVSKQTVPRTEDEFHSDRSARMLGGVVPGGSYLLGVHENKKRLDKRYEEGEPLKIKRTSLDDANTDEAS